MQKFTLRRFIKYSERLDIEAENFEEAKKILLSDTEFERNNDDRIIDQNIEYCGEVK